MQPTTRERELTEPVDLCAPDGVVLNPEAVGFSRVPLHRANLARRPWGRTKRWDYWAVLAGDVAVAVTYADIDYLGIAAVWWADLASGEQGGREVVVPLARGLALPERPGTEPLRYRGRHLRLDIDPVGAATRITAAWSEPGGGAGSLEATVDPAAGGGESLGVVVPWGPKRFQYTSKHQARPVRGHLSAAGRSVSLDGGWGVLDVGRGRWPYRTRWNWGAGAGRTGTGRVVGLQFGGRWTEGTGSTENGVLVDGRLIKLGDELEWSYRWEDPMAPWRVRSHVGVLDVTLTPRLDRHARTELGVLGTEVHQVFGSWSGRVPDHDGGVIEVVGLDGFAEESRSRW